jgi:hypothetical protein
MKLKTRKKNRIKKIFLKFKKGALRCSEEIELDFPKDQEAMLLVVVDKMIYVNKDSKLLMNFKRKGNLAERQFYINNSGKIIKSPRERKKITYAYPTKK